MQDTTTAQAAMRRVLNFMDWIFALIGWIGIFAVWIGMLLVIFGAVPAKEVRDVPMMALPAIAWDRFVKQHLRLWRSQRIRSFLQRANDLRMRKQRVDGFFPRRTRS